MVTRTSKILMVIATAFTFLGVALEILLHSNQENFFPLFSAGIQLDEPVVHTVNLWSTILIFLLYLVSCIVLMCASKRTGFVMSIVALVLNLLVNAGARVGAVVMNRYMGMKGVKYLHGNHHTGFAAWLCGGADAAACHRIFRNYDRYAVAEPERGRSRKKQLRFSYRNIDWNRKKQQWK